jgi:hypothetical protein
MMAKRKSSCQSAPSREISQRPRIVLWSSLKVPVNRCEKSGADADARRSSVQTLSAKLIS